MRLFVALDIDPEIRERIVRFLDGIRGFAPDARWVNPESLHITLKFIGEMPDSSVGAIEEAVGKVKSRPMEIHFRGSGFFPNPKSARVFWLGIEAGPQLAALAADIDSALLSHGVTKDEHTFSPHLTLARRPGGSGSPRHHRGDNPNPAFQVLQKQLATMGQPDFGTMTAREFCLYASQLSPKGSKYTKLQKFALG